MYNPLLWISYLLDSLFFGASPDSPWGYHLANVFLHAASAVLLFFILRFSVRRPWVAFFAAAFWALHPLRVESVAWVTERKDTLSTVFAFASILSYLRGHRPDSPPSRLSLVLSFFFFICGILSKPMLVTLPFLFLLLDFWPLHRFVLRDAFRALPRLAIRKWPFFLVVLAAAWLTYRLQTDAIAPVPLLVRIRRLPVNYFFYFSRTLWPAGLCPLVTGLPNTITWVLSACGFFLVLAAVAIRFFKRAPGILVGLLAFAGLLFPVSGIVFIGSAPVADRYSYLPAIGLSVALSALPILAPASTAHRRLRFAAALAILMALSAATLHLMPAWRDSSTLIDHILRCNPHHPLALVEKAKAFIDAGDPTAALSCAVSADSQRDYTANASAVHALALQELGRPSEALGVLEAAPRRGTPSRQLYILDWETARVLFALGRRDEALACAERALAGMPPDALASEAPYLHLLAMAAAHLAGRSETALAHARAFPAYASKTAVADSDLLPFYLSEWRARHRTPHADALRALLRDALARDPGTANNLVWGFATTEHSPFPPDEILQAALRLVEAVAAPNPAVLDTLAAAQARAGRFDEASATAREALALLADIPASPGRDRLEANLRARLALYRDNRPYSEDAFSRWLAQAWGEGLLTTSHSAAR